MCFHFPAIYTIFGDYFAGQGSSQAYLQVTPRPEQVAPAGERRSEVASAKYHTKYSIDDAEATLFRAHERARMSLTLLPLNALA
jgi:hypothetical protein